MTAHGPPPKQGLYDPQFEHDACGVGFVVNIHGSKSHDIIRDSLRVLLNLEHRGACGSEANTGDGAGILIQSPHNFFAERCDALGIELPEDGRYGCGMIFLPQDSDARRQCELLVEQTVQEEGQTVLGWRTVPTDDSALGPTAKASQPVVRQVFISRADEVADDDAFERRLYIIRKRVEAAVKDSRAETAAQLYIVSLSYKTVVYKGMLTSPQLGTYYPDLSEPAMETALALVHSRFSTNTFPSWARAHPYR